MINKAWKLLKGLVWGFVLLVALILLIGVLTEKEDDQSGTISRTTKWEREIEMKTFEIMFDDLTEEAQRRFLEFQGLENSNDGNYDVVPIAVIELEDD